MVFNGFFGHIQGPFKANQDVYQTIVRECSQNMAYISKIGFHYPVNFDYPLSFNQNDISIENPFCYPIVVQLYDAKRKVRKDFQLGKTGILELQDVKITAIQFLNDVDDNIYIDYQYEK